MVAAGLIGLLLLMGLESAKTASILDNTQFYLSLFFFLVSLYLLLLAFQAGFMLVVRQRYARLEQTVTAQGRSFIPALCSATGLSLEAVSKGLGYFMQWKLLPKDCLDEARMEIMLSPPGYAPPGPAKMHNLVCRRKSSVIPIYTVAAVWLLYAARLPLYRIQDFIIAAIVSLLFYFLAKKRFPAELQIVPRNNKALPESAAPTVTEPEFTPLELFLRSGSAQLRALQNLVPVIRNETVRAEMASMIRIVQDIFTFVKTSPKKIPQLSQFMNYYLPTTVKLLTEYRQMETYSEQGETMRKSMGRIESYMQTATKAFLRELDALHGDTALDITADIAVLESLMNLQGESSPFESNQTNSDQNKGVDTDGESESHAESN